MNVLINDPGASHLYSLAQNVPGTPAMATFPIMTTAFSAGGATISINLDGSTAAGLQATQAGETFVDTFTYTIRMADGALSTATATMNIAGVNDPAVFTGADTGSVHEDLVLTTGGTLIVTDPDHDQSGFQAPTDLTGDHGTFTFDTGTGLWGYSLTNSDPVVQALNTGDTLTDTLAVLSTDGTSHNIVVTIHGEDEGGLPPAGGGDGDGDGHVRFMVNNGLTVINGHDEFFGFVSGDIIQYSQNFSHLAPVAWDNDNNGSFESTAITFSFNNGVDPDFQVILVGYTGAVAFFHESV